MTNADRIISEVLELDEKATNGPWSVLHEKSVLFGPSDHIEGSYRRLWDLDWRCWAHAKSGMESKCEMPWVQFDPDEVNKKDAALIAHYRSSAPKIAKALKVAIESLIEWDSMRTLDEIESILVDENELGKGET